MSKKNLLRIVVMATMVVFGAAACYFMTHWEQYPLPVRIAGFVALFIAGICLKSTGKTIGRMP
jgi:hypothetical protein